MKPLIRKTCSWESFCCHTSLKRYAKALVFIVIFLKVTHYSDCLCKSPLIQALLNNLLNVKSMLRFFFFPSAIIDLSVLPILSVDTDLRGKKNPGYCVFVFLSFKWSLLSPAIICLGCKCMYSGWDWISEQEELKDLLCWS